MTRRCSVMRMPLAVHKASMSLGFGAFTTLLRPTAISWQGGGIHRSRPSVISGWLVAPFGLFAEFRAPFRITPGLDGESARPSLDRRGNSLPGVRPRGNPRADKAGAP